MMVALKPKAQSMEVHQRPGRVPAAADPTCPVLHAAACRKLLDTTLVPADRYAHRAARVAPDVIGWTAQAGSRGRQRGRCRHGGRPALGRGEIRVLAPRKRAVHLL